MAHSVFIQVRSGTLEENCEQGFLGIMLSISKILTNFPDIVFTLRQIEQSGSKPHKTAKSNLRIRNNYF